METEERDARGPIITHMGRAADAVASDVHKLLTFAALVRRDLVHGLGADDDAEILRAAARQLRDRADHLAALAEELADGAMP
jgi:acyl-CoA reductase-like NAD-dependent aldehyde dehydrogenase